MKKVEETDEAMATIRKLLSSGGSRLDLGDRLRKAAERVDVARKGGSARQLVRAVSDVARIACEELLKRSDKSQQQK